MSTRRGVAGRSAAAAGERVLTAVVPVWLDRADHEAAHRGCHASALLWNRCVAWLREEWRAGRRPGREDVRRFVTALPAAERPVHAHTAQAVAYDLWDAVETARARRAGGATGVRLPWREKAYRPLVFTRNFGWRTGPAGGLSLSLGRGRRRITVPLPVFTDREGVVVDPGRWGEITLCWDGDARMWALHVSYRSSVGTAPDSPAGRGEERVVTVAVDEGVINPLTLVHRAPDGVHEVTVINGRSGRSIKRGRNKAVGRLSSMMSRCRNGSRRHRRLAAAKRKTRSRAKARLRDFNHQVTAKAAEVVRAAHDRHQGAAPDGVTVVVRVVVGDVRGIEQRTARRRRVHRSTRQQLSQWDRGTHEHQLAYKTGLEVEHISEAYTSQSCPRCGRRRKVRGRWYACGECGLRLHRDAVGGVNILTLADNDGTLVPVGPSLAVRVTYLRAQPGWGPLQRALHSRHQRARGRAGAGRRGSP
ncbi:RNA-guided endonuclease InsQ/TnpB family protein [Streptomyces ficellus]|uniref:Cas12f1-like TNB domain-containing protein n=1 Tax=Streptomyces ficellus TaxID=1977088 RepID=A0A6I6FLK3_9ACTN|nr:zinc ribbon domain-containing protein [Streptomyces ficellus]QGV80195.1 hypothetical protein EIZ62_19600 [Streptomyces ficellus]